MARKVASATPHACVGQNALESEKMIKGDEMMAVVKESTRWEKMPGQAHYLFERKWPVEVEELNVFGIWALCSLADGAFLVVWACAQWVVNQVVDGFQLSGIDHWTLVAIQLLFAVATLVPILTHICVSTTRAVVQGWIVMQEELKRVSKTV